MYVCILLTIDISYINHIYIYTYIYIYIYIHIYIYISLTILYICILCILTMNLNHGTSLNPAFFGVFRSGHLWWQPDDFVNFLRSRLDIAEAYRAAAHSLGVDTWLVR